MRVMSVSAYRFWDGEDRKGMPSIYLEHKAFVDAGHDVLYVYPGPERRVWDCDGVRMHQFRLRYPTVPGRFLWTHRLSLKIFWWVFLVFGTWHAWRLARGFKPDVIYGQFFYGAPVAWLIGRVRRIPNITRMYGTFLFPWVDKWWGRLLRYDEALAFRIPCAYFIMTNDGTRGDDCARALGMPPERLKFWRNGVNKEMRDSAFDKAAFKAAHDIPPHHALIVTICRLERWKGVDRLIAALPAVLASAPDTTAVVVGDGDELDALRKQAAELGVAGAVRFTGAVRHEETVAYMNAADVFVSLYHLSNVGNPLIEAIACGRCIVTLDNGATAKLVRAGETGTLIAEDRLDTLPGILVGLLRDPERRARFERAAYEYGQAHLQTWPERLAMEVDLVETLVGVRGAPGVMPAA